MCSEEIEGDVNIQAIWTEFRNTSGAFCDLKMSLKLKGNFTTK